jgi:uncharacterized protein YcbK (DUF882 family)
VRRFGLAATAVLALLIGTRGTQDAVANGDTRTLSLYHNHTRESLTVTFRRNGRYDPRALEQLNWLLRDWRRDEPTRMDPRLFDTLWEVQREVGSSEAIHVNSAYRSPATNSMLRRRSNGVAKNSQHMRGKAIDFYLPDVPIERVRAVGMRLQDGGVGYYPSAYTPFVHLDVGSVRAWPRMTREQLVRLFPDGKTVHIPADGEPLPRYEEARAEVLAKGGSVGGYTMVADGGEEAAAVPRRRGFWATLFGWDEEDEDAQEIRARPSRNLFAGRRTPTPQPFSDSSDNSGMRTPAGQAQPRPLQVARAEPPPPRTRIAGLPGTVETPSGPRLDWQQGPQAQVPTGSSGVSGLAFAPMPPRRPEEVLTTGALPSVPLPPVRPGALAAWQPPGPSATEPAGDTAQIASSPGLDHPLPPPRPGAPVVAVAAVGPAALPAVQPAPAAPGAARAMAPASAAKDPRDEKAQLRTLLADAANGPVAREPAPKPQPVTRAGAVLAMGFSASPMGDLTTSRFTGPAVKPLPVAR